MRALRVFGVSLLCVVASTMAVPATNQALQAVIDGNNQFSSEFFRTVGKSNPGNLITSPLSASVVLSMIAQGARGNTEKQLRQALHHPQDASLVQAGNRILIENLNNLHNVKFNLANKVYIGEDAKILPSFQQSTKDGFYSESQNVNFGNSEAAAKIINDWCEAQTNNRIKNLVKPSDLDPLTRMVLVNAVYFKGQWEKKFDPDLTTNRPFHVSRTVVQNVPMMFNNGEYKYAQLPELKAQAVELPYKNKDLSMVIILPDSVDGLPELEQKLGNIEIDDILKSARPTELDLRVPKFKIESTINLNEILKQMGMSDMFDEQTANFTGISNERLFVSKVLQKAFIEVNEEGSEAAAATGIQFVALSLVYPLEFKVDRPFLYTIVKTSNNYKIPLFAGRVVNPTYK